MNLKEAFSIGLSTGEDIATSNVYDYLNEDSEFPDSEWRELFKSDCAETESDHFRQYSPFEFTAKEFNESRNPDRTWEEYERGVYKGIAKVAQSYPIAS